jgi:ribosomal protein L7Ae-like RNA K-turn-binding protein
LKTNVMGLLMTDDVRVQMLVIVITLACTAEKVPYLVVVRNTVPFLL